MDTQPRNQYQAQTTATKLRGQYYTPPELVAMMLDELPLAPGDLVIDPACGDGSFLRGVVAALARRFPDTDREALSATWAGRLVGFDVDAAAVAEARVGLRAAFCRDLRVEVSEDALRLRQADVLAAPDLDALLKQAGVSAGREEGRLYVVGNPPYVEAKRLGRETTAALKERYPQALAGAPDLYLYFLHVCLGWLREEDILTFVLPNKLLVNANAQRLRERLLDKGRLRGLWFATQARIFTDASVYPIVLLASGPRQRARERPTVARIARTEAGGVTREEGLPVDPAWFGQTRARALFPPPGTPVLRGALESLLGLSGVAVAGQPGAAALECGGLTPLFSPVTTSASDLAEQEPPLVPDSHVSWAGREKSSVKPPHSKPAALASTTATTQPTSICGQDARAPRLGDVLDIRWAVSFHRAGLREQYVVAERPDDRCARPFLGGGAFTGNGEVTRYRVEWAGWWIRYDTGALQAEGNPLPDPAMFERPKVVICQNGRTLRAALDEKGYILKDTFLCGVIRDRDHPLCRHPRALVGLLCSQAVHFFYAHVFYGGHVNGGYLHFLRSFLVDIPVGDWTEAAAEAVAALVHRRAAAGAEEWEALEEQIEARVAAALGLTAEQQQAIAAWAAADANWQARERVRAPRKSNSKGTRDAEHQGTRETG